MDRGLQMIPVFPTSPLLERLIDLALGKRP